MVRKSVDSLIRNTLLLGIGITSLTRQKVEKLVAQLRKNYDLNERDARRLADKTLRQSRKVAMNLQREAQRQVRRASSMVGLSAARPGKAARRVRRRK